MLICALPGCETMTRIDDLLIRTKNAGAYQAEHATYDICLKNHWLTRTGRKHITRYLQEHFPRKVASNAPKTTVPLSLV